MAIIRWLLLNLIIHKILLKVYSILLLFLVAPSSFSQNLKLYKRLLDQGDFQKLQLKIDKELVKTPKAASLHFIYSLYFFDTTNTAFQLDSAYVHILKAIDYFSTDSVNQAQTLTRTIYTIEDLLSLKQQIEDKGLQQATNLHSVESYQTFIDHFPQANQLEKVTRLRNELAYAQAIARGTYADFKYFIDTYPDALEKKEATKRYEKLLFVAKTSMNSIENYAHFIKTYPSSPHRASAEKKLYYLFVEDGRLSSYKKFVEQFSNNPYIQRAWQWIYALDQDRNTFLSRYPNFPNKAFVSHHLAIDTLKLFPFFEKEHYGFIDIKGKIHIPPTFKQLGEGIACSFVDTDYIIIKVGEKVGVIDKEGKTIIPTKYDAVAYLAAGIFLIKDKAKYGLAHRAGFSLIRPIYDSLRLLKFPLLVAEKDGKKGMITYYDSLILDFQYHDIQLAQEKILVLKKDKRYSITLLDNLNLKQLNTSDSSKHIFDKYEFVYGKKYIKVYVGNFWGLIDFQRREIIAPIMTDIAQTPGGWVLHEGNHFRLLDTEANVITPLHFQKVISGHRAYAVKIANKWGLVAFKGTFIIQPIYDTLIFVGESGVLLTREDKQLGYFYQTTLTDLTNYQVLNIRSEEIEIDDKKVTRAFIITQNRKKQKGLLDDRGNVRIAHRYQNLSLVGGQAVLAQRYQKYGLLDLQGNTLLDLNYDGIFSYKEGHFSLLKNKRFGLFYAKRNLIVAPAYDVLLKTYGNQDSILIAKKEKYGLIDYHNQIIAAFQFDEITYWNDSIALVKEAGKWKLYDFLNRYFLAETFEHLAYIRETPQEIVLKTYRGSGYGLLSSTRGRIVPEEYNEISNVGNREQPFYLLEKSDRLAGVYIFTYVNMEGERIKKFLLNEQEYIYATCAK